MQASIDTSMKRLGLALAAALGAAAAGALVFDTFEDDAPRARPADTHSAHAPRVLERVLVRPSDAIAAVPGLGDRPADTAITAASPTTADAALPPEVGALPRPEAPRGAAVVMDVPERPPATPSAPLRREPTAPPEAPRAAPRDDIARTVAAAPDTGLARRLNREGIELIDAGRPAEAIAPLERAASLQPRDAEILGNLGYAYMLAGEHDTASRHFTRALDVAPRRSATWLNLGQTYAELGDRERAVDAVVTGYRHSSRKASVRSALLAAATGNRHSPQWREAAGMALVRIGDG